MAQSTATDNECGICLDALTNPVALPCRHIFCSNCLDSWRSKYGFYGKKGGDESTGKTCPLCREKIPPSREMLMQLNSARKILNRMKTEGDQSSTAYTSGIAFYASEVERLELEVGDWTEESLEDGDEYLAIPAFVAEAAYWGNGVQAILDWLGPPPVDKKLINARNSDWLGHNLICHAVVSLNPYLLSILLQLGADIDALSALGVSALSMAVEPKTHHQARLLLEWGVEVYPKDTRDEFIECCQLDHGNTKLASLMKSELGGRRCELVNYSTQPDLNGKTCVVEKYLPERDRYKITFEGSQEKALVPPHNLKRRDRTPTDCGYYITFNKGKFSRREFVSKEECQAYVAEVEAKGAAEQLAGLDISSPKAKARSGKSGKKGKKGKKKGRQ